jgi:hypothetical protein
MSENNGYGYLVAVVVLQTGEDLIQIIFHLFFHCFKNNAMLRHFYNLGYNGGDQNLVAATVLQTGENLVQVVLHLQYHNNVITVWQ